MSTHVATAACLAESVELVDKNNARGTLFGLLEHIADTGRTDADEHLDEVRSANAKERHARLACDRFAEQRLAGARRAHQEDAFGNASSQALVTLGVLEEVDHFTQLFNGFFNARHVVEGDIDVFLCVQLAAATTKRHGRPGAAHASDHEYEQGNEHAHDQ